MAQRLVRKLCPDCRQAYNLDEELVGSLKGQLDLDHIFELAAKNNLLDKKLLEKRDWRQAIFIVRGDVRAAGRKGIKEEWEFLKFWK